MSRCDCEGVFYRVFCVSLLVIAFTFTVILTNVFVDIDNLLSKREKDSTENVAAIDPITEGIEVTTEVPDYYIGVETNDQRNYRSKRSLGAENFFLRINSPKTKSYLTSKLATLLEALDEEDQDITTIKPDNGNIYIKTVKQKNNIEINELLPETDKRSQMQRDEDILYLALHKMLQGIRHVDKYQLINKLQAVVTNSTHGESQKEIQNNKAQRRFYSETTPKETLNVLEEQEGRPESQIKYKFEDKGVRTRTFDLVDTTKAENKKEIKNEHPTYLIKTIIDIENVENTKLSEDFEGVIKVMYNGKPIKIKGEDYLETKTPTTIITIKNMTTNATGNSLVNDIEDFDGILRDKFKNRNKPDTYLKTIALEYIKKMEKSNDSMKTPRENKIRIKRHVQSSNEKQMELPHTKDDEELFVEIETHFDKSGLNAEKKRKLVSSLVEKIQSAIRSSHENTLTQDDTQRKPFKKRVQNPIDQDSENVSNIPFSSVYRTLDPISKLMPLIDPLPLDPYLNINWRKQYSQPKFLSLSKSINSAELNQVAVDYKLDNNDSTIPKRVQLPLSIDTSQEIINTEDLGKLQLLMKDIKGTGFSIGYNQYVDQVPDLESINLFHGIENIIKKYQQKNNYPDHHENNDGEYEIYGQELKKREVNRMEAPLRTKRFLINRQNIRQSIKKVNDHTNAYVYNDHYHSFDTYKEFLDTSKRRTEFLRNNGKSSIINAHRKKRSVTLKTIMNSNKKIRVNKYLNTKVFRPQKRYFKLTKRSKRQADNNKGINKTVLTSGSKNMFIVSDWVVSNNNPVRRRQRPDLFIIDEKKSNRFLNKNKPLFQPSNYPFGSHTFEIQGQNMFNTNPMFVKSNLSKYIQIHENIGRIKRQLHTLRIIDRDIDQENSDHKGLTEYGDGVYAKKEVISDLDGQQIIPQEDEKREYIVEYSNDGMKKAPVIYNPFIIDNSNEYASLKHRNTDTKHKFMIRPIWEQMIEHPLMAKYPHLFEEVEIKEERPPLKTLRINTFLKANNKEVNTFDNGEMHQSSNVQDLVKSVVPKNHYKVSIRLIPNKGEGDLDNTSAFKEIHTSINKTYNKNGLQYFSLVNVSEISHVKVPDTNRTLNHQFQSTTPNITEVMKIPNFPADTQINNNIRDKSVQIIRSKSIETTTKPSEDMNLMDIIVPSSPRKVIHFTVADLGKIICDAVKPQHSDESYAKNSEKAAPVKTTTLSTTTTVTETTQAPTPTEDPLKMKLLKSISQNEHLTSQILNRIEENTDILQMFLSKITYEIAKLPDITNQAIIDRDKMNNLNIYTTTTSMTPSNVIQQKPHLNIKQAATGHHSLIQQSPVLKPHIRNNRMDMPTAQTKNEEQTRIQPSPLVKNHVRMDRRELPLANTDDHAKYFLDQTSEDTHKQIVKDALTNDNTSKHKIDPNNNAVVQKNTLK